MKQIKDGCATPPETPRPAERLINYSTVQAPTTQIIGIITVKTPLSISVFNLCKWLTFSKKVLWEKRVMIGNSMMSSVFVMWVTKIPKSANYYRLRKPGNNAIYVEKVM